MHGLFQAQSCFRIHMSPIYIYMYMPHYSPESGNIVPPSTIRKWLLLVWFTSFEFSVELLDLMDDVINLQGTVFHQLDRCHDNSMTASGQCKLYPLMLVIQDSCQLYDCLVKMLFKLHKGNFVKHTLPVLWGSRWNACVTFNWKHGHLGWGWNRWFVLS